MGQAAKYTVLGAAIALLVAAIAGLISGVFTSDIFASIGSSFSSFVSVAGSLLRSVRGGMNYFFGPGSAVALNALIWVELIFPALFLPIKIGIVIYRWVNQ